MKPYACLLLASAALTLTAAEDEFALGVRTTEPNSPAEQQKTFRLPPGFEIQLVAAEPDINKPMNLAFDAAGRLWATTSIEYPWAAPTNAPARDRLMIFEDFGPDGRARKVTQFADNLNIPIGVYPFRGADLRWKAYVWSIPYIWLFEDTDGDGKADKRTPAYGPFDYTRDTHGNQSSFTRGFDGWIYATHGFNNDSRFTGPDGLQLHFNSGNTYRFRVNGSRLEQHTWGQVNPFGLTMDERGNLYSSDCHSAPIYQLLAGGYYPSFGKPHDGLGFAPVMMEHAHGSTAIDGAVYYSDNLWPDEYKDNFFIGNVMTSRLNRDQIVFNGSSPQAIEKPDFVTTTDPWFRPVHDILGPDGALYIADFYNRIIGHYEVPLSHPGRDRERGRIWRVVYTGKPLRPAALASDLDGLINELGSPNLPRRLLAMNEIQQRYSTSATPKLLEVLSSPKNVHEQVHALWMLHRLNPPSGNPGPLPARLLEASRSSESLVRIHAARIATDILAADRKPGITFHTDFVSAAHDIAMRGLGDSDALVRRCSAEALGNFGGAALRPTLDALAKADPADDHLVYVLRKALRDELASGDTFASLKDDQLSERDIKAIADVAVAVKSEEAGRFLIANRQSFAGNAELARAALQHAASYAPPASLDDLAKSIQRESGGDVDFQLALFRAIRDGFARRGVGLTPTLKNWAGTLALQLLDSVANSDGWANQPLNDTSNPNNPWGFNNRVQADTRQPAPMLDSIVGGEPLTGRLLSKSFAAPRQLKFFLSGHDGYPDKPAQGKNVVQLRDAATGEVLATAKPPRNDVAQQITWDLAAHAGKQVFVEVVDADTAGAYAWLAIGRFEPAVVPFPSVAPATVVNRQIAAPELAGLTGEIELPTRRDLRQRLVDVMHNSSADYQARAAAMRVLNAGYSGIADLVIDRQTPLAWKSRLLDSAVGSSAQKEALGKLAEQVFKEAPQRVQVRVAMLSTESADDALQLVSKMEAGNVSANLLRDQSLKDKLQNTAGTGTREKINTLIAALPETDATFQRLIDQRRRDFAAAQPDKAQGEQLFTQLCAVCHQLGGKGALVGPQLEGIGNRGVERLCEDILDPNRNVDHAFATTTLVLKNGDVESGLFRREEGAVLVLANSAGKEFTVAKSEVSSRTETTTSLMPANFGEALTVEQFANLLGYLLEQRK